MPIVAPRTSVVAVAVLTTSAALTLLVQWGRTAAGSAGPAAMLSWMPSLLYGFGIGAACLAVPRLPRDGLLWAGAGALLYECLQPLIPGRTFDPHDLLATVAGLALAVVAGRRWSQPSIGGPAR